MRTDPHCHILPGLDDGSPNMAMSLRMARRMVQAGITAAVATPHGAHPGIETNVHPEFLREQVEALCEQLKKEEIPLKIYAGTEIFLRDRVRDMFDQGQLTTWADQGRFVLVELGFQRRSESMLDVIDHFRAAGLTPIIAHPERYLWLPDEIDAFLALRDRGCVFQFNMMSINGHFGPRLQQLALRLMQHAGDFIIGTDSHSDAEKYFDFVAARTRLASVGLLGDNGEILPGRRQGAPDLSGLPL